MAPSNSVFPKCMAAWPHPLFSPLLEAVLLLSEQTLHPPLHCVPLDFLVSGPLPCCLCVCVCVCVGVGGGGRVIMQVTMWKVQWKQAQKGLS